MGHYFLNGRYVEFSSFNHVKKGIEHNIIIFGQLEIKDFPHDHHYSLTYPPLQSKMTENQVNCIISPRSLDQFHIVSFYIKGSRLPGHTVRNNNQEN